MQRTKKIQRLIGVFFTLCTFLLIVGTKSLWACPSCVGENDEYLLSTLFLIPLPILILGFLAFWVYKNTKDS